MYYKEKTMKLCLPSRYEDLNESYRGRLMPNSNLLELVDSGFKSMQISGGIRFLPIYGESGSGKSCAAREIDSHMPQTRVFVLERKEIENADALVDEFVWREGASDKMNYSLE